MELTAFETRLGTSQGRIRTREAVAGDHLFVLGDDQPGRFFNLVEDDRAEVVQETDLTDVDLIRAQVRLRVPTDVLDDLIWEASIIVDNIKLARATARPGSKRIITDLAANVSKLSGIRLVGVRLQLVGR